MKEKTTSTKENQPKSQITSSLSLFFIVVDNRNVRNEFSFERRQSVSRIHNSSSTPSYFFVPTLDKHLTLSVYYSCVCTVETYRSSECIQNTHRE